ncbi:MAG TPA: winged helix-turn-helix domain-containing protein, partial [Blastocatellia bacterium]|nr:winged helix-turn-helix domain-containing protein [Blastocatellia bacterium]
MIAGNSDKQITFPPFRLDAVNQCLWRSGQAIPLRPKTFAVLHYLLERPGQLVTKNELLDALWPDTSVTDAVLKVCIREIREALGDDPTAPQFIETAHRRGYRFIGRIENVQGQTGEGQGGGATQRGFFKASRPIELIGRGDELARLHGWLERALAGERQVIFVTGEPGIGKTTLVEAFLERISTDADVRVARGQCLEQYGASEAYMPVLEAFSRLCQQPGNAHLIALLARYAPMWLAQMAALINATEREALQREILGATRE